MQILTQHFALPLRRYALDGDLPVHSHGGREVSIETAMWSRLNIPALYNRVRVLIGKHQMMKVYQMSHPAFLGQSRPKFHQQEGQNVALEIRPTYSQWLARGKDP